MEIASAAPRFFSSARNTALFLPPLNSSFLSKPFCNRRLTRTSSVFLGLRSRVSRISSSTTTSEEALPGISGQFSREDEEEPAVKEPSLADDGEQNELLDKLPLKLGSGESYVFLLYGTGAVAALWLSSIIVGILESIPVFPQVMEVVGLSFTIWFSYRYLLFKKSRDELVGILDELKGKVFGFPDN